MFKGVRGLSCKPNIYVSWSTSELRVRLEPLNWFKPPVKYFTDRSKAELLLWIFYVFVLSCVCYVFVRVCLYVLCGHLLGKGWPLGSRLWCLTVSLSLSHCYPVSGVVLDCIDSWSLHPYLLCTRIIWGFKFSIFQFSKGLWRNLRFSWVLVSVSREPFSLFHHSTLIWFECFSMMIHCNS